MHLPHSSLPRSSVHLRAPNSQGPSRTHVHHRSLFTLQGNGWFYSHGCHPNPPRDPPLDPTVDEGKEGYGWGTEWIEGKYWRKTSECRTGRKSYKCGMTSGGRLGKKRDF